MTESKRFIGAENWYRHALVPGILLTGGVKYVADTASTYWLLDEIALAQRFRPTVRNEEFQLWKLNVKGDTTVLTCENGDCRTVFSKPISFTDFQHFRCDGSDVECRPAVGV